MPSRIDTAGQTKAFDCPVMDHWGESQSALARGRFELPTCRSTVEHANHQTTTTAPHPDKVPRSLCGLIVWSRDLFVEGVDGFRGSGCLPHAESVLGIGHKHNWYLKS